MAPFKRVWLRLSSDPHSVFRQAISERRTGIFRSLDFPRFANFVCDQFLSDKSNPFHRYVLTVLLRFLFSEDRHMVVAWLIGQKLHDRFLAKLGDDVRMPDPEATDRSLLQTVGIADRLNRNYKVVDTIKILVSLFASDMGLSPSGGENETGRVFFFAFDQIEGLDELFDEEKDWFKFFAKLSELYNSLPNVFIVFTMTVGLRERLYAQMENQFRQRLQRDDRLVLRQNIPDAAVSRLFLRHVQLWRGAQFPGFEKALALPEFQFLPFTEAEVWALARQTNIRGTLELLDREFRKRLVDQPTRSARQDYVSKLNEVRDEEAESHRQGAYLFTRDHLKTVHVFLSSLGQRCLNGLGLMLEDLQWVTTPEGGHEALRIQLARHGHAKWVRYFLGQAGHQFTVPLQNYDKLLSNLQADRNFLWVCRALKFSPAAEARVQEKRPGRIQLVHLAPSEDGSFSSAEARFRSLSHLLTLEGSLADLANVNDRDRAGYAEEFDTLLRDETGQTYLGEMMRHALAALDRLEPVMHC